MGKADLDLLEAELDQKIEHPPLAVGSHRLDQGLIAVPQIDAAPSRRPVYDLRRPAAVGQGNRRKGAVFVNGHSGHQKLLLQGPPDDGGGGLRDRERSRPASPKLTGRR